ncbi:CsbD family protein [Aliirhizobium smilacinae]|uniref:CsbD family protein n=1 Tax=Aliirhizobium smilacinae TaxID=1395944 RepID=A0A5C4XKB5_9HYPH|nr:CsbD family protein [Rhizobium smilacinae]TNM63070.1 CsbD family protein [Rhizobium smilacinae]
MGSTADKVSGKANALAGKAKQSVGKATGSHETQAKGAVQEAKGDAR